MRGVTLRPRTRPTFMRFVQAWFPPLVPAVGGGGDLLMPDQPVVAAQPGHGRRGHLEALLQAAVNEMIGLDGGIRKAAQYGVAAVKAVIPQGQVVAPRETLRVELNRAQRVIPIHVVAQRAYGPERLPQAAPHEKVG